MSACEACGLDTFAEATGSSVCSVCPVLVSEGAMSTLFIKDCRELCNNYNNATLNVEYALPTDLCCYNAPLQAVSLDEGIFSVEEIEQRLNAKVVHSPIFALEFSQCCCARDVHLLCAKPEPNTVARVF